MRIIFSCLNPPVIGFGGGALTANSIVKQLIDYGHEVSIIWLDHMGHTENESEQIEKKLINQGCRAVYMSSKPEEDSRSLSEKIRWRVRRDEKMLRPWSRVGTSIKEICEKIDPDICFLYGWESMCAFIDVRYINKIGAIGNSHSKLLRVRLNTSVKAGEGVGILRRIDKIIQSHILQTAHVRCVESVNKLICFAQNEANEWTNLVKTTKCVYLPNFVPDDGMQFPVITHEIHHDSWTIVHVGHLRGTATLDGLRWLSQEVIPELKKMGVISRCNFKFVGKFQPPEWLLKNLSGVNYEFTGFIDNFETFVRNSDAFIVPTVSDTGNRTRIATAWSLQCCVVAHQSSTLGMPEIINDFNCALASSAVEYAKKLIQVCTNEEYNTILRRNGRETYLISYSPEVVKLKFHQELAT